MIKVKATREGLVGQKTASTYVIDKIVSFVALPNEKALFRFVHITNLKNSKTTIAQVLDIGPWNIDDPYADPHNTNLSLRPLAEQGIRTDGLNRVKGETNGAGIDLGEAVWNQLEMEDNGEVTWEWIS